MNMQVRIDGPGDLSAVFHGRPNQPPLPNQWRGLLYATLGLFLLLFVLAVCVPIGGAVIGGGQVGVESRVKRIAHPLGGVVAEVPVVNGEHVEAGQLLLRLDDHVSGADATYTRLSVEQMLAQRARLDAEQMGRGAISFPPELANSTSPTAREAMANERHLFAIRRAEEGQLRAELIARIGQYKQSIRGIDAQIEALRSESRLIGPERRNVRELWDKQLVTIGRLNQLERTAVELEGNLGSQQAQIAETRARIAETQEQLIQLGQTRRVQAGEELAKVNATLNEQQLRSVSASDQKARSEIRAPYSGTVEKIAFTAIGDVIRPAEPIMEIVPDHDAKVVETMISPTDVDQVQKGQTARVRFSAYNRAESPELPGKVVYVAADKSENPEAHSSYYMVRVEVDQAAIKREGMSLVSGMPVEVHIETGSRSLMSYLTKPLRDQFARAFRDN